MNRLSQDLQNAKDLYKLELLEIERILPTRLLRYKMPLDVAVKLILLKSDMLEQHAHLARSHAAQLQGEVTYLRQENRSLKRKLHSALRVTSRLLLDPLKILTDKYT